jgi:hypothetical protein
MTELDFRRIHWPRRFTVNYRDGRSEVLSGEDGVMFSGPADDPLNRGFITAKILPKSARRPRTNIGWRGCYLDEIRSIVTPTGEVLWSAPS